MAALPFFAGATVREADQGASAFLADTGRAMETMDAGMMAKPSGEVDHDFVQMMVPHHQGAIDMAIAEIRYGHDERLKRIAQEIIVDQQQEIAAMRLALGQPLPPSLAAPTQAVPHHARMRAKQES
uniref:DUF305 domain-containing protein n=1 Tax=Sphingomonas bacterium TaxID=1895847 RepID=UPI00262906A4|nr:DUF305 domain-containing protein [Sphingomonas bacterium]